VALTPCFFHKLTLLDSTMIHFMRIHKLGAVTLALSFLLKTAGGQQPTLLGVYTENDQQCPIFACCERDCCGNGTAWDTTIMYCVEDSASQGFQTSYPDSWESGCATRVCCEQYCCDDGLLYDTTNALCLPDTCNAQKFEIYIPYGKRTMRRADVKKMYECCSRGAQVILEP